MVLVVRLLLEVLLDLEVLNSPAALVVLLVQLHQLDLWVLTRLILEDLADLVDLMYHLDLGVLADLRLQLDLGVPGVLQHLRDQTLVVH